MDDETQRIRDFQEIVWDYYRQSGRHDLPWRLTDTGSTFDPYKIMVSEIMLQQTQVGRVVPKYQAFLERFPTVQVLADAELGDVLRLWTGLGYNRRAKFLHQAAQAIVERYDGVFPDSQTELVSLPGVGLNTAGAILAYAFNQPLAFIETNIRTVFIHHFFGDQDAVDDTSLQPLIAASVDTEHPREWYWALMDYGSYLKATVGNRSRQSKTYAKQSTFVGSKRQVRGRVIRLLGEQPHTRAELEAAVQDDRFDEVLSALVTEGMIRHANGRYTL